MRKGVWLGLSLFWLAVVIAGCAYLMLHSNTPGEAAKEGTPKMWPSIGALERSTERPTLVMFAHPKCPCTRASIGELATLMTQTQGKVDARVVFYRPKDEPQEWAESDTWRSAAAIPGVTVQSDVDGRAAKAFHAVTSGHVVLYDRKGRLVFSGGITGSRGHAGDNAGRSAVVEILNHGGTSPLVTTPTFGCAILTDESEDMPQKKS